MLVSIYYFFGIFILLSLISNILRFNKIFSVIEWHDKFVKVTKKYPKKEDFRSDSDWISFISRSILLIIEGFWILFGLITNNWFIFLSIILYTKIIGLIFSKIKYTIIGKYIHLHLDIIKILLYLLMIVNHFHLELNLLEFFRDFLLSP